jgi:hypothetical protein
MFRIDLNTSPWVKRPRNEDSAKVKNVGVIPPLSRHLHGLVLKHRANFTFTYKHHKTWAEGIVLNSPVRMCYCLITTDSSGRAA